MVTHTAQDLVSVEDERIKTLYNYDLLDTPPEVPFDKLTRLAANLLKVPIAIILLVDKERIWFKSKYGLETRQIDREEGLCDSAVLAEDLYLVENAAADPRTMGHRLVTGTFGLRFYAAYPLKTRDGYNLGAFCVISKEPRKMSREDSEILRDIRDIVMHNIELRLTSKLSAARQQQILNTTAHDLKNPLTTIPVRADLIKMKKNNPEMVDTMCDQIKVASLNMVRIIDELLQSGSMESDQVHLLMMKLNVSFLVSNVVSMNLPLAERKGQTIHFSSEMDVMANGDEGKLNEVIDNLVNNAIKYSPLNTNIYVRVKTFPNHVLIEVEDEGQGLTAEDKKQLFQRFTRLSARPTAGEHSTGLGLSIVKTLVEAHGGRIFAESAGKGSGAKFSVELPLRTN
ncbi:signal transduction histidine kinase [Pedobacter sp. AK017]|uniref:GAF domain-containing sensor histidine kinase n=1 Tax=Pedobacter sp. AK017 TaxID=2723073 RepID=UPI001609C8D2|nr:GAF domain-containing sensor histidine kinase [Pedobacter sp. AK017]MBB5437395.1 signal transduction histidine kinase [Pedobacter sp. AK017]